MGLERKDGRKIRDLPKWYEDEKKILIFISTYISSGSIKYSFEKIGELQLTYNYLVSRGKNRDAAETARYIVQTAKQMRAEHIKNVGEKIIDNSIEKQKDIAIRARELSDGSPDEKNRLSALALESSIQERLFKGGKHLVDTSKDYDIDIIREDVSVSIEYPTPPPPNDEEISAIVERLNNLNNL